MNKEDLDQIAEVFGGIDELTRLLKQICETNSSGEIIRSLANCLEAKECLYDFFRHSGDPQSMSYYLRLDEDNRPESPFYARVKIVNMNFGYAGSGCGSGYTFSFVKIFTGQYMLAYKPVYTSSIIH